MYLFIVSERGDRTNICSNFRIFDINGFLEHLKTKENKYWRVQYRVAKLNDDNFETRIFKYINLDEFEEIFEGHIDDIKNLLKYTKNSWGTDYPYFKKEIHIKYGELTIEIND